MNAKRTPEKPKDVMRRLRSEGWTERKGKGDHVNFVKTGQGVVTIDTGGEGNSDWHSALDLSGGRLVVVSAIHSENNGGLLG